MNEPSGIGWYFLVVWQKLSTNICTRGSQIYVEGRIQTRKWNTQSGEERTTTEIIVSDMQILGSRSNVAEYDSDKTSRSNNSPSASDKGVEDGLGGSPSTDSGIDDEIPF